MRARRGGAGAIVLLALHAACTHGLRAQERPAQPPDTAAAAPASALYDSLPPLAFTLTANFNALIRDRREAPPWRPAVLTLTGGGDSAHAIPVRLRPRGLWRRRECAMPPLRVDFARRTTDGTPFAGVNRPKLVVFCENRDRGDQYVLQEMQLYRIYQLFTPMSHRVRLAHVTYVDSGSTRVRATRYGFFLEEPQALAARVGGRMTETRDLWSDDMDAYTRAFLGVFQFFIGNTDWSTSGLHNIELLVRNDVIYPIAFDFDFSGAVNAHYAVPPPTVRIRSVRERSFRGNCAPDVTFEAVFAAFREHREAIHALYADEIGRRMDPAVVRRTLAYFDEFYRIIDDPARARSLIVARCASRQ